MHNLHPVLCFAQTFAYLLRNHDRAIAATGAAKGDGQVALAFLDVVWQQIYEQLRDALDELLVWGNDRMYLATFGSRPVSGRNAGMKWGLGRKRTSKSKSASSGTPCLKPKLTHDTRMFLFRFLLTKAVGDCVPGAHGRLNLEVSITRSAIARMERR